MNKKILMLGIMLMMSFSVYTVNAQTTQVGNPKPTIEVETIQVLEGTITIRKVEYDILPEDGQIDSFFLSETFFGDDINQTCSNGAEFKFSATGPGSVDWIMSWSSGWTGNSPYCSGSQCNYTVTTDWSAYYTTAVAHVYNPQTVWGPSNAYKCR